MIAELPQRRFRELVPDHELVIVPARGELAVLCVPSKPADFLLVPDQLPQILIGLAHISVEDQPIARPGGQDVVVPGKRSDASGVSGHGPQSSLLFRIPDLHQAFVGSDGQMGPSLYP